MYVDLIKQTFLSWAMVVASEEHGCGKKVDFTEVNRRMEQLLHGAESCQEMIDNRRKISDIDFYNMLKEFADISWADYDYYNILEMAYNTKFAGDATIKTAMHTVGRKVEGHGRDFSWWNEEIGIDLKILYTEGFEVDYEHFYTTKEIKQLIAEKKILIISEEERNLAWEEDNYKKEKYLRFDCIFDDYSTKSEFFDETGKFYKYTLKYIKKQLNNRKLKKLFSENLDHVEDEIYNVTSSSGTKNWDYVTKEYSKVFEENGYAKRLTKLKEASNK